MSFHHLFYFSIIVLTFSLKGFSSFTEETVCHASLSLLPRLTKDGMMVSIVIPEKLRTADFFRTLNSQIFRNHRDVLSFSSMTGSDVLIDNLVLAIKGPRSGRPDFFVYEDNNNESIRSTVASYVADKRPIEGVTFWGGARQYGRGNELGVDGADLMALSRLEAMNQAVRESGYKPGVRTTIIFEDLGRRFMGGYLSSQMKKRVEQYEKELNFLVRNISEDIQLVSESQFLTSHPLSSKALEILGLEETIMGTEDHYFQIAQKSEDIIYKYLRASEKKETKAPENATDTEGFTRVSKLPEYHALEELGFRGGIPMEQRNSTRKRTLLRLGNETMSEAILDRHVARYFAQAFTRSLLGVRNTSSDSEGKSMPQLSLSFLPYPKGTPTHMLRNRIELAAVRKSGNELIPCWGGCAVFQKGDNEKYRLSVRSQRIPDKKYERVEVVIRDESGEELAVPFQVEVDE